MDKVTPEVRSRMMKAVAQKNTAPEIAVRRLLHSLGYRYRLHVKGLPGRPDLVFKSRRKVIFVHGCFWHGHDCRDSLKPRSRESFWEPKIARNRERDLENEEALRLLDWDTLTIWECETTKKMRQALADKLLLFLGPSGRARVYF